MHRMDGIQSYFSLTHGVSPLVRGESNGKSFIKE
jgi:hypothetical protein